MPYVRRNTHKHAAIRRFKRRILRGLLFLAVIIVASYTLNYFLNFSRYSSKVYEPKDIERERMLKNLEDADKKAGKNPSKP